MTEINYKELKSYLKKTGKSFAPVYLVFGEEYLYKQAFKELLDRMVPQSGRDLSYEPVDEESGGVADAVERLNTFSFTQGPKVVSLCESKVFYSKQDDSAILEKAKKAFGKGENKKAAKFLGSFLSLSNLSYDDVHTQKGRKSLKLEEGPGEGSWVDELVRYCVESGILIPAASDKAIVLKEAIEQGFPQGHHLVITTDIADKRRVLYKTIKKYGVVIDCSVPAGDRKADKAAQDELLRETMKSMLGKVGKAMDREAFVYVCGLTGFDMRAFTGNLEKLISFVGDKQKITVADAKSLLKRSKQDPIYELTGALAARNLGDALFFIGNLLANALHPLQILSGVINQVRKLLLAKDFTAGPTGRAWKPGMDYNRFQASVLESVKAYDGSISACVDTWESVLSGTDTPAAKNKKAVTDLKLAANPRSPYPLYLLLKNSDKYSKDELIDALMVLGRADLRMKSTGEDAKIILEDAVINICRRKQGR